MKKAKGTDQKAKGTRLKNLNGQAKGTTSKKAKGTRSRKAKGTR